MKKKLTFIILFLSIFVVNHFASNLIKSYILAFSLAIKDIILFVLPFIILLCVLNAFLKLGKNAFNLVFLMLSTTFISTYTTGLVVYPIGIFATSISNTAGNLSLSGINALDPAFQTGIEQIFSAITALFAAIILTFIISIFIPKQIDYIRSKLDITIHYLLNKMIIPMVPFFVYGFALKIVHDQVLFILMKNLSLVFIMYLITMSAFILTAYFFVYRRKLFIRSLKEISPALMVAITTVSSNVAMPFLLKAIKNLMGNKDAEIVDAVTPPSVNFHLIGDCFLVNIFLIYIYSMYNDGSLMKLSYFLLLNLYIALSRFMGVAIPGGGAFIVSPILEANFGFTKEMTSLFTTIYMLLDFINTAANVMANGYYVALVDKIYHKIFIFRRNKNKSAKNMNTSKGNK
ncbi:dicarboxylate/amino acid:cation symporter [Anaplasmataceae bacterium AB001_6]|nr:dicarboxylate/amino acid:cation symporter [Anaplasmataceae bacterium AB001_6]